MTRVLWLSRHAPAPEQVADLERALGPVEIVQVSGTVSSGADVKAVMAQHGCTEVVAVLPVHLLADLIREGVRPIRAQMAREVGPEGQVTFRHQWFERVERIDIVCSRL